MKTYLRFRVSNRPKRARDLPLETTRLVDLFEAVQADCDPRAIDRSIVLEFRCESEMTANINPPLLEQAVINLVDNAIKYSDTGRKVFVSADRVGHDVVIRVQDEGCGIEQSHLPRLLNVFIGLIRRVVERSEEPGWACRL